MTKIDGNYSALARTVKPLQQPPAEEIQELAHAYECNIGDAEADNKEWAKRQKVTAEQILCQLKRGEISKSMADYQLLINEEMADRAYQMNAKIIRDNGYKCFDLRRSYPDAFKKTS